MVSARKNAPELRAHLMSKNSFFRYNLLSEHHRVQCSVLVLLFGKLLFYKIPFLAEDKPLQVRMGNPHMGLYIVQPFVYWYFIRMLKDTS